MCCFIASYCVCLCQPLTLKGLHTKGRLPTFPSNVRLGWKRLVMSNKLAWHTTELNTTVKKFYSTGPPKSVAVYFTEAFIIKLFTAVINSIQV
jgi:hypothetical protein